MGKFVIVALIIVFAALILEFFQIVDVPFLEIPDFLSGKAELVQKTSDMVEHTK